MLPLSSKPQLWRFHVFVVQSTAKLCTKMCIAHSADFNHWKDHCVLALSFPQLSSFHKLPFVCKAYYSFTGDNIHHFLLYIIPPKYYNLFSYFCLQSGYALRRVRRLYASCVLFRGQRPLHCRCFGCAAAPLHWWASRKEVLIFFFFFFFFWGGGGWNVIA